MSTTTPSPVLAPMISALPAGAAADALALLRSQVHGPVLVPGDPAYPAEVAGFNAAFSPTPGVVVGAACAGDVQAAVRSAVATGARLQVQSTGHGLAGDLHGTVLVTTRRLCAVAVDARSRTARVGAGVPWRAVIDAAAPHGLAPLCGSASSVGAVGSCLGGGTGLLSRQYGFAADAVTRLEVVTGDGVLRRVDAAHEPELFWALRGGRSGLGVVTEAVVDLVPVTRMLAGGVFFPGESADVVLHAWRAWAPQLPREVSTSVALLRLPPSPALPEPLRGRFVVHLRFSSTGDPGEAERLLAPVRALAPVLVDTVAEIPFRAVDTVHGDPTTPLPVQDAGTGLRELPAAAVDALLEVAGATSDSALASVELRLMGGALSDEPGVADCVLGRGAAFSLWALGVLAGPAADAVPAQLGRTTAAVAPWACPGPLNLAGAGDHDDLRTPTQRARLDGVRRACDPRRVLAG